MKVKFGGMIVGGRGKFAGLVGSHNRGGDYFRQFVVPTNPQTVAQTLVRNDFANSSQGWRALTEAERIQWNSAVNDYQRTNVFGDLRRPSGKALFQRLNGNLLSAGQATITAPLLPAGVDSVTSLSLAAAAGAQTVTVTFAPAIAVGMTMIIEATPAVSPGVSNANNLFRQIRTASNGDASPLAVSAAYIAKFGAVGAAGSKIFVRVKQVNNTTGEVSTVSVASAIIAA